MHPLTVVLVRPPSAVAKLTLLSAISPPLGLAYVAGAVRAAGFDLRCIDAVGEAPFQTVPMLDHANYVTIGLSPEEVVRRVGQCDVVGISVMFSQDWTVARSLLQAVRRANPRATLVAGGEHVSALAEFCLSNCAELDVCVLGEGEDTMVAVLRTLQSGGQLDNVPGIVFRSPHGIIRTAPRGRIQSLEAIPWPAWDLLPIENYLGNGLSFGTRTGRTIPMLATRGCPFSCTFCSSPQMWGTRWQARAPDDVLAEMEHYIERYNAQSFDLYDLTAIVRRDWLVEFCQKLIDRQWNISWEMPAGTRSEALDAEVLALIYRSGARDLCYAPESGSERTLKLVKKKVKLPRMKASMREAIKVGLNVKLNMVMGFPHETREDIWQTMLFLKDMALLGVHDIYITCFMPYPGSELFRQLYGDKELDDTYFLELSGNDVTRSISHSPHISDSVLNLSRLSGMFMFYGLSYAARPSRFLKLLRDLGSGNYETRISKNLRRLVTRATSHRVFAGPSVSGSDTAHLAPDARSIRH